MSSFTCPTVCPWVKFPTRIRTHPTDIRRYQAKPVTRRRPHPSSLPTARFSLPGCYCPLCAPRRSLGPRASDSTRERATGRARREHCWSRGASTAACASRARLDMRTRRWLHEPREPRKLRFHQLHTESLVDSGHKEE
jgi:hypothetical protein